MSGFRLAQTGTDEPQPTPALSAFSPFRSRIFLAMWIASLLSNFGTLIQGVGAAWLMTSLAPSADMVALVQVSTVLPIMLFSLPAGAAADVWDRRIVMLVAQGAMLAVSVALAGLAWLGLVTPWLLIALTFLLGTGAALHGPAWQSAVREQVPRPDLPAAVALNSVSFNLARAAGPALGGAIVAWAGAQVAFAVNAVSYLGLIAVLLSWRRPTRKAELPPETMTAAMLAGLRFARLSHSLQAVLVRSATFGFFAAALWALIPLVAGSHRRRRDHLRPAAGGVRRGRSRGRPARGGNPGAVHERDDRGRRQRRLRVRGLGRGIQPLSCADPPSAGARRRGLASHPVHLQRDRSAADAALGRWARHGDLPGGRVRRARARWLAVGRGRRALRRIDQPSRGRAGAGGDGAPRARLADARHGSDQPGAGPGRSRRRESPAHPRPRKRPGGGQHGVPDRAPRRSRPPGCRPAAQAHARPERRPPLGAAPRRRRSGGL